MRGGAEPTEITANFISAAIRLVRDYFWPHARAALRQVGLTERHIDARRALRWTRGRDKREVSIEDIRRDALGQKLDAKETGDLLDTLTRAGWLREKEGKTTSKGGRSVRRWEVNPNLFPVAETALTAQTRHEGEVSAVSAVSAPYPIETNGAGSRRNDLEDYPLAPASIDKQPTISGCASGRLPRSPATPRRPAAGPSDDGLDMPTTLQRCRHCGKPGAKRRDWNGRAVHLHEYCERAWADQQ
jgi:hypothetical protein